ncbi:hypothetical protein BpHYR1_052289 [Brachionus plicatilis]|uniref:Sulfatase N-terminal domain-containing protein n=1 Tax=Brachionus plicatilis TaxID=10195 RepID=A0A3M7RM94_BRAPC|nr:hypothetical protein BpHYR1_052289 [Brachionus plicatilis]
MRGFKDHATKHYPKHYQLRLKQKVWKARKNDYCNGDTKRHKILVDLLLDFKRLYHKKQSNIALMHYVENSHDSNDHLHWLDDDILYFLNAGINENLFDSTILFLYSDHGSRFNKKRSSQRYLEERLPFFSVYLPDKFMKNNQDKLENFKNNLNKLTSPFDIYATVRDVTCLERDRKDDRKRSISLFDSISKFRSCEDIGIAEHFCSCVKDWKFQDFNSEIISKSIKFAIESINKITSENRNLCRELSLKDTISAEKFSKSSGSLYRVSFITAPNNGIYETIVYENKHDNFEFSSDLFSIKSKMDISRIDSYGEQPKCVAKFGSNPGLLLDLRKFCYCYS